MDRSSNSGSNALKKMLPCSPSKLRSWNGVKLSWRSPKSKERNELLLQWPKKWRRDHELNSLRCINMYQECMNMIQYVALQCTKMSMLNRSYMFFFSDDSRGWRGVGGAEAEIPEEHGLGVQTIEGQMTVHIVTKIMKGRCLHRFSWKMKKTLLTFNYIKLDIGYSCCRGLGAGRMPRRSTAV